MSESQSKKAKIMNSLNQLKELTTVVADTGDFHGKITSKFEFVQRLRQVTHTDVGLGGNRGERREIILQRLHIFFSSEQVSRDSSNRVMIMKFISRSHFDKGDISKSVYLRMCSDIDIMRYRSGQKAIKKREQIIYISDDYEF